MTKNIILCGVGGQGTVLASRLISSAAMARDIPVLSAETIGMAQRGGSVFSHVRMSTDEVLYSPMIAKGEADLIIAFEPGEAVRQLPFLKPDGRMVVSSRPVMPVTAALSDTGYRAETMLDYLSSHVARLTVVDAERALKDVGSPKVLNLILLGAALRTGALGLETADLKEAIRRNKERHRFHAHRQGRGSRRPAPQRKENQARHRRALRLIAQKPGALKKASPHNAGRPSFSSLIHRLLPPEQPFVFILQVSVLPVFPALLPRRSPRSPSPALPLPFPHGTRRPRYCPPPGA